MKRRTFALGVGGLAAIAATGWLAWRESSRGAPQANRSVGLQAELSTPAAEGVGNFFATSLTDLEGRDVALASLAGQPLVVNFWATWCAPCVEEMPTLSAMAQKMPNVRFVGIGIDTVANIRQFVDKIPVSYPLLVAGLGGVAMVRDLGNTAGGLPFTVLFDAKGNMIDSILGQVQPDDLTRRIAAFIVKSKT